MGAHLSVAFKPMKDIADKKSRVFNEATEWELNPRIFHQIINTSYLPNIDLFFLQVDLIISLPDMLVGIPTQMHLQ